MIKLFIYGTLKNSYPNHHYLKNGLFLGNATTVSKYPMIYSGNFPCLYDKKDTGNIIQGECYEIDEKDLKRIDSLEGHPNFFERKEIEICLNNETITVFCYFKNDVLLNEHSKLIEKF